MISLCPPVERLKSLSCGNLTDNDTDQLLAHLYECDACQQEMSQLENHSDTFIGQLKAVANQLNDPFETEPEFHTATARALAALTSVADNEPNLPQQIGEYEVLHPIGHGGMGRVFAGQHTKLGRPVAIKILARHRHWDQTMQARFAAEMKVIGSLNHPNIVVAHDAREVDGVAVLVTELIDGLDVGELLRRNAQLTIADGCAIAAKICAALEHIAAKNLVHRDIKPSNIMVSMDGSVKLLDLGLARLLASENSTADYTATGQAMGTADYIAPEQINNARNVDGRADIYGLGCTLYKLLSGRAPFATAEFDSTFAKMNAHVSQPPQPLSELRDDVPRALVALVQQMLAKSPQSRPQSVVKIATQLERFSGDANLASLVQTSQLLPPIRQTSQQTELQSQSTGAKKARTLPFFSRRVPLWAAIGAALAGIAFGALMSITLTIKKTDGSTATVTIPEGSMAVVDADGNVEVQLAGGRKAVIPSGNVQRAATSETDTVTAAEPDSKVDEPIEFSKVDSMGRRVWFELPHKFLSSIGPKDRFDLITQPQTVNGRFYPSCLLVSNFGPARVNYHYESADDPKLNTIFYLLGSDITNDEQFQSKIEQLAELGLEPFCVPHDKARIEKEQFRLWQGVWRCRSINGQLVNGTAMAVIDRRVFLFGPDNYEADWRFELKHQSDDFGKRSLIEISYPDPKDDPNGRPVGIAEFEFAETENLWASQLRLQIVGSTILNCDLERVEVADGEAEQRAFAIVNSVHQFPIKLAIYVAEDKTKIDKNNPIITNRDFVSAKIKGFEESLNPNLARFSKPALLVELTEGAADKIAMATESNVVEKLIVMIDDEIVMEPKIMEPIRKREFQITGRFTKPQLESWAENLVPVLGSDLARQSEQKLLQLTVGLLGYEAKHMKIPASRNNEKNGGPPFSWRIAILPFIGQNELYRRYHFDQPWDSPANQEILESMPDYFRRPGDPADSTTTGYVAVVGKQTYVGDDKQMGLGGIVDGTSNTIALIESETSIPWTKPEDFPLNDETLMAIIKQPAPWFTFATGDGAQHTLRRSSLTLETLNNWLNCNDRKFLPMSDKQNELGLQFFGLSK